MESFTWPALTPNFRVDSVWVRLLKEGFMLQITTIREPPVRLPCRRRVSLESRKGMNGMLFWPRALMTIDSVSKLLLMFSPYFLTMPSALVLSIP